MKTGRVYKIIATTGNECYVGSTFNTTRDRFKGHKSDFKTNHTRCTSFDLFNKYGVENCKMILIKEYEVVDRSHLEVYETLWIKKLKAINKLEPFGSKIKALLKVNKKIYYEKNKERITKNKNDWYKRNKERIAQATLIYREKNKERIRDYQQEYIKNNRESLLKSKKNYYKKNKEHIRDMQNKVNIDCECDCGSRVLKNNLKRHLQSKKHLASLR